jgi:hypothetical protein
MKLIPTVEKTGRKNASIGVYTTRLYIHHCDTHHKLGRWGLVTFGAIGGYSHKVVALKCNIDNYYVHIVQALEFKKTVSQSSCVETTVEKMWRSHDV